MKPQPTQFASKYAEQFADPAIVSAYRLRPSYPAAVIDALSGLAAGRHALLDIGCGYGNLCLPLVPHFEKVDAVDPSAGMIEEARKRADEHRAHIRWQRCRLGDAALDGPYDLVTAGESLHWTNWPVDLPRLAGVFAPSAPLAIVSRKYGEMPWTAAVIDLRRRYSTNRDYRARDLVEELRSRGLFHLEGRIETEPIALTESAETYIEAQHSSNGFSRDRMDPGDADAFGRALLGLIPDPVTTPYWVRIEFGRPCP